MEIQTHIKNLKNYQVYLEVEKAVLEFLQKKGYLKIDLPVLSPVLIPESYLEVFKTEFRYFGKKEKLYLTPSPELFLKRLLSYGIGSCYYLGKAFRNSEPPSSLHSFEFIILEFYKINADYMDLADELLQLLQYINKKLNTQILSSKTKSENLKLIYRNKTISLQKWEKISVAEAFERYAGILPKELFNRRLFLKKLKKKGYRTDKFNYGDL